MIDLTTLVGFEIPRALPSAYPSLVRRDKLFQTFAYDQLKAHHRRCAYIPMISLPDTRLTRIHDDICSNVQKLAASDIACKATARAICCA